MRNYELFMRDYLEENDPNTFKSLHLIEEDVEAFVTEACGKEDVYKENYYLMENLQLKYITEQLKKNKVRDKIVDFVGIFIDTHMKQLETSGPVYTFTFGTKELKPIYELFGLDSDKILELYNQMIIETYYGKISKMFTGWVNNAPHKILITAILIDAVQNGYDDIIECCEYMWAFTEYPILYREYWKLGVKEDVMNATIEHLGSKFIIKQVKNIKELLKYDATTTVNFYYDELKKGVDNVYNDLLRRMRNQLNSKFKNISKAYYENVEANITQHNNVTTFDDGELADQEGAIANLSQIIEKVQNKMVNSDINKSIVKISANGSQVDKSNLEGMIGQIYGTKNNRIAKFVENVITVYFQRNPSNTAIEPGTFINYGLALFRSLGSSKDPMLSEIKSIVSFWMDDIIDIKSLYQREPTQSSYTRAIYNYFILMINYYN